MSKRDFLLVVFLLFSSVVGFLSLLFGNRMWLLLENSGISRGLFVSYLVLLVVLVLGSLGFLLSFVFKKKSKDDVVVVNKPLKLDEKKVPSDDGRRLRVLEEVEKNKRDLEREVELERLAEERKRVVVQVKPVDKNIYYDNGYEDENGIFHEYENNNGG